MTASGDVFAAVGVSSHRRVDVYVLKIQKNLAVFIFSHAVGRPSTR